MKGIFSQKKKVGDQEDARRKMETLKLGPEGDSNLGSKNGEEKDSRTPEKRRREHDYADSEIDFLLNTVFGKKSAEQEAEERLLEALRKVLMTERKPVERNDFLEEKEDLGW